MIRLTISAWLPDNENSIFIHFFQSFEGGLFIGGCVYAAKILGKSFFHTLWKTQYGKGRIMAHDERQTNSRIFSRRSRMM